MPPNWQEIRFACEVAGVAWVPALGIGGLPFSIAKDAIRVKHKRAAPGPCCEICQSTLSLEVDHIQPLSLGGSETQTLCAACHQTKSRDEALAGLDVPGSTVPFLSYLEESVMKKSDPREPSASSSLQGS